jgi:hypothetical protein
LAVKLSESQEPGDVGFSAAATFWHSVCSSFGHAAAIIFDRGTSG